MNKKAYELRNIIGIIIFIIAIVFIVLLTKNKGSFSGVWQEVTGWFGR